MLTQKQVRSRASSKIRYIGFLLAFLVFPSYELLASSSIKEEDVEKMLKDLTVPLNGMIASGAFPPGGTLGGAPHFSVGGGVNILSLGYEDPSNEEKESFSVGSPFLHGRVGVIDRVDFGLRYGYIPKIKIFKKEPTLLGAEVRIGILKESLATPGVSIAASYNWLSWSVLEGNGWGVDLSASSFGIRVLIGKGFLFFYPYGGLGWERYWSKAVYEIPPLIEDKEWKRDLPFLRVLLGCELTIFPFIKAAFEYNRLGTLNIYTIGLRGGF